MFMNFEFSESQSGGEEDEYDPPPVPAKKPAAMKAPRAAPRDAAAGAGAGARAPAAIRPAKKTPPAAPRKKRRLKSGARSLRDIQKLQKSTNLIIPRLPLGRIVREIAQDLRPDIRFQEAALGALHEAAEAYLIRMFRSALFIMLQDRRRTTLKGRDLRVLSAVTAIGWTPCFVPDEGEDIFSKEK